MRAQIPMPVFTQAGMLVDPDFLPAVDRARLKELAQTRGGGTEQQAAALVKAVSEWAHCYAEHGPPDPGDATKAGLTGVADKAHALLHALHKLTPGMASSFGAHWDWFALGSKAPRQLHGLTLTLRGEEGRFLGAVWGMLHDLRDVADYAAEQVALDRANKPGQNLARGLVHRIAHCHRAVFGVWPKAYKGHWFPEFCAVVGRATPVNLKIGQALVAGVLLPLQQANPD